MPELPELEVMREVLERRVIGQEVCAIQILPPGGPLVVRDLMGAGFTDALNGMQFESIARRGKFLVFTLSRAGSRRVLALNLKLTGRLQLAPPAERRHAKTHVIFDLSGGQQLRYLDQKRMGQLYLADRVEIVPGFADMGPEALEITLEDFGRRLKTFRGEIKGVLAGGQLAAGIGNAYADEILWAARLHPYRKVPQLSSTEAAALHEAMRVVLRESIDKVRPLMGEEIHRERREFMAVHMKTGKPCPRCGTPISLVAANQRITNFCRTCQPGGLIKGMV